MAFSLVFYCSLFKLYIITHIIFVNLFNNFHTFIIKFVYYNYGVYVAEADKALDSTISEVYSGKLTIEEALKSIQTQVQGQIK